VVAPALVSSAFTPPLPVVETPLPVVQWLRYVCYRAIASAVLLLFSHSTISTCIVLIARQLVRHILRAEPHVEILFANFALVQLVDVVLQLVCI
jgi:hypothetical protein